MDYLYGKLNERVRIIDSSGANYEIRSITPSSSEILFEYGLFKEDEYSPRGTTIKIPKTEETSGVGSVALDYSSNILSVTIYDTSGRSIASDRVEIPQGTTVEAISSSFINSLFN